MWRVVVISLLVASAARAQDAQPRFDPILGVPATAAAASFWIGGELLKEELAPMQCVWCDEQLNPVDAGTRNLLRWDDTELADALSNVALASALTAPASLAMADGLEGHDVVGDLAVVTEAIAFAGAFNLAAKLAAGRQRPFVRALAPDERARTPRPDDNTTSFFSGHATMSFAAATSSGTIASLRGSPWAPLVWATGLATASATGWLRIAADRHYLSDVLTGAAVGGAIGVAVPLLLRHDVSATPRAQDQALPLFVIASAL